MRLPKNSLLLFAAIASTQACADTVAFWPFDEPVGLYPSSALADHAGGAGSLVLGPGGSIVQGKFGGALSTAPQEVPPIPKVEGGVLFGLTQLPTQEGRTVPPMSWMNARFAALNTAGEKHLRKRTPHQPVSISAPPTGRLSSGIGLRVRRPTTAARLSSRSARARAERTIRSPRLRSTATAQDLRL
jgi:hypothetical protein